MKGRVTTLTVVEPDGTTYNLKTNIDLELLEKQRVTISGLLWDKKAPSSTQLEALEGIQNFLDGISDKMFFREKEGV